MHLSSLQCMLDNCSAFKFIAVRLSSLQCIALSWQWIEAQRVEWSTSSNTKTANCGLFSALQCIAVNCSALQVHYKNSAKYNFSAIQYITNFLHCVEWQPITTTGVDCSGALCCIITHYKRILNTVQCTECITTSVHYKFSALRGVAAHHHNCCWL